MARGATSPKDITITNFPKRDGVQKQESTGKHRTTVIQDCVGRRCREFRTRDQHGRSRADSRGPRMWMETAYCESEPVVTTVEWKGTLQYLETVPRCFFSCETETDRDTHLRVASSLATVTTRRRLRYTRTRRTLWDTDRNELDEPKQMPAEAQSTDPGEDAETQTEC